MSHREALNEGYNYMHARGVDAFSYYVGVNSLEQIANRDDRVCVINILGKESRAVTPVSHAYSGGNVVCGTMAGRSGSRLPTALGDIPVYGNVLEALEAGCHFNTAVVYVPPAGVKGAITEAVRVNPELKKIFIVTEKVPVRDARIIRQFCQWRGVDVFGANCLGAADAHAKVRIGGALGGNTPEESLVAGSVAVYSNSGNFTTTIATYLQTAGWGTTVSLSSGKDVYIHFAAPEFVHALHNDPRSKAAVMYIEPGGYYERDLELRKPVVACVVGRWKERLVRPCGHAGAIIGEGDSAAFKEQWFLDKFGVDRLFSPEDPVASDKGAVVNNIAHVPLALDAVMRRRGEERDFAPRGDLRPKCWFANTQGLSLPATLELPVVEAVAPYDEQIARLEGEIGALFPRRPLKDASGASKLDPQSQVAKLHGVSVLAAAERPLEDNLVLALTRAYPDQTGRSLANVALNATIELHGRPELAAAEAAREAECSPNSVLAAAVGLVGPRRAQRSGAAVELLVELFRNTTLKDPSKDEIDLTPLLEQASQNELWCKLTAPQPDARADEMARAIHARGARSVFVTFVEQLAQRQGAALDADGLLAAIATHLCWKHLRRKRVALTTATRLPWHLQICGTMVGAAAKAARHLPEGLDGVPRSERLASWSFADTAGQVLLGEQPGEQERAALQVLFGLTATNGPGTISAQGAKGAVSADGPESAERLQVNKAYVAFLTHTGFAHGGNGYEAISFLRERFAGIDLGDPAQPQAHLDLEQMARSYARDYREYKARAKAAGQGGYRKIPCVNHPVFKGKPVNHDPREVYVKELMARQGSYNIFHEFYHQLVHALHAEKVSREVYCVNVDAVLAVTLLKLHWPKLRAGMLDDAALERSAFVAFLFGRLVGSAAELEDHANRGRAMDTRTPASACTYV
jgi:succinyl-CoA synthetase alpha subunit